MRFSTLVLLTWLVPASAADYTTYIGDANEYQVTAMATDANGNTYVTGSRTVAASATGLPETDVFVGKLDAAGNVTLLATVSGKGSETANAIVLDSSENIFIAGFTNSMNFPLRRPLQSTPSPSGTGFLVKMSADGSVVFSTYLGGTMAGGSVLTGVAVDSKGDVYVTGSTNSPDYPRTPGMPAGTVNGSPTSGISGAFFAKISSAGDKLIYAGAVSATSHACFQAGSSCFLSPIFTDGTGVAVDTAGNAYIAGNTTGVGINATPEAFRTDGRGPFVLKINPAGSGLVYLTFLSGAPAPASYTGSSVNAIAVDAAGNAYVAGETSDPAFPTTTGVVQPKISVTPPQNSIGPPEAFIAKLNPTGTAMVWATFLGGAASDEARRMALDPGGTVWVSGTTNSPDFPASLGWATGSEFLIALNTSGSALTYSARFPENYAAASLAVDSAAVVHYAGSTGLVSASTPSSTSGQLSAPRVFGIANAAGGPLSGRIAPGELISIYGVHFGPSPAAISQFDEAGFLPTSSAGVQVLVNDIAVPLLYVSDTQINAVAPRSVIPGITHLRLIQNGRAVPDFRVVVETASPRIFPWSASGGALVINQDGSINSQTHPAKPGSYVSIWATGAGSFPGMDGQMATSAQAFCRCEIHEAFGNDALAVVSYAGAAPGIVNGVVQINFQVSAALPLASPFAYYLSVNAKPSDPFGVYISP